MDLPKKPESEDEEEVGKQRIKSLLTQLEFESTILDRIVYKGKNQHRRALYFQYLLKVRRDVKLLLHSANLKEILNLISVKPNQSAKRRKLNVEKHHIQMRLLGVARLLSQMVEPMVKAAIEFSSLLARSFFISFSITILALLARLRVLVQQILLDVVSVFNMFSSCSQGDQLSVLKFGGVEVIREYHPSDNNVIALECVWDADKFVLFERANQSETTNQVNHAGCVIETPLKSSNIKYETIEAFLGDDEVGCEKKAAGLSFEELLSPRKDRSHATDSSANQFMAISHEMEVGDTDEDKGREGSPEKNFSEGGINASTRPFPSQKLQTESSRKVAFVSVSKPTQSQMKGSGSAKKEVTADCLVKAANDKEDPFFSLLAAGHIKDSLF